MSDAATQRKRRDVAAGAIPADSAGPAELRSGLDPLAPLVGEWVYFETLGLNYRGVFRGLYHGYGPAVGPVLLVHPLFRVGAWDGEENEPAQIQGRYEEEMPTSDEVPGMVPMVACSLLPCRQLPHWPKGSAAPRRKRTGA